MMTAKRKDWIKTDVAGDVRSQSGSAEGLIEAIGDLAEPPFGEFESSRLISDYLADNGFVCEFPYDNMPTALRAEWGKGKPVIGLLGEYDALPNCGASDGQWGHGCGHNLLGVAPAVAAVTIRNLLDKKGLSGKVVYYGCPAEETLGGKVFMSAGGAFKELDACLSWHPSVATFVDRLGGAALDSLIYEFHGKTSHAAASAHRGRSALDAAILMDVSVNYLREHVPDNVRIHSVITHGGDAPNVVPAYARIWYFARGRDRQQVDHVRERMDACAKGAAMATGTRLKKQRELSNYNLLTNDVMGDLIAANFDRFGPTRVMESDRQRAGSLGLKGDFNVKPAKTRDRPGTASSDEANVSWITPLGTFRLASYSSDTPAHHRLMAAQSVYPFARRATLQAAKVMAGCALDIFADPEIAGKARAEFRHRTRGFTYDPLLRKGQKPPKRIPDVKE